MDDLNNSKQIEKLCKNGTSTTGTYKSKKLTKTDEKRKKEIKEKREDTVQTKYKNNIGKSYVRIIEFNGYDDVDKNDVHTEAVPRVSWADIVKNKKAKIQ